MRCAPKRVLRASFAELEDHGLGGSISLCSLLDKRNTMGLTLLFFQSHGQVQSPFLLDNIRFKASTRTIFHILFESSFQGHNYLLQHVPRAQNIGLAIEQNSVCSSVDIFSDNMPAFKSSVECISDERHDYLVQIRCIQNMKSYMMFTNVLPYFVNSTLANSVLHNRHFLVFITKVILYLGASLGLVTSSCYCTRFSLLTVLLKYFKLYT